MPALDTEKYPIRVFPAPTDGRRYPMIVFLHGNFGLGAPYGELIAGIADDISKPGYVTAVPRYYPDEADHLTDADPEPHVPIVAAAIEQVAGRDDVDASRLGIVGYSLGAAIAMSLIGSSRPGWASVFVDFYGPLPANIAVGADNFPPTAIFHNRRDEAVKFEQSLELCRLLPKELDVRLSGFTEDSPPFHHVFDPREYAHASSLAETLRWLEQHLPPRGI